MREFFKGWRRKAGGVALVIALPFVAWWARSYHTGDWIGVRYTEVKSQHGIFSYTFELPPGRPSVFWRTNPPVSDVSHFDPAIPYWCVTIPLALLSAYLILWKPRPKEQPDA